MTKFFRTTKRASRQLPALIRYLCQVFLPDTVQQAAARLSGPLRASGALSVAGDVLQRLGDQQAQPAAVGVEPVRRQHQEDRAHAVAQIGKAQGLAIGLAEETVRGAGNQMS